MELRIDLIENADEYAHVRNSSEAELLKEQLEQYYVKART